MRALRAPDYAQVVRAHHTKTTGYIVAVSGTCIGIRDAEIARIRRKLVATSPEKLDALEPKGSWILAFVICPVDDLRAIVVWLGKQSSTARRRVRLYAHPDVDLVKVLKPWYAADLEDPRVAFVTDFASFHKRFGNDLNDQVYADAKGGA